MQYTAEQIKTLLKDYPVLKGKVESGLASESLCQAVNQLEKCVSVLYEIDFQIITLIYFEGNSYSVVGKKVGFSKPGIQKRVKNIIKQLAKMLNP